MIESKIVALTGANARIATGNIGEEVSVFGLVFSNPTASARVVNLTLHRQSVGSAMTMPVDVPAKSKVSFEKTIGLQPGDWLDVSADAVGTFLLWSADTDDGATPVESAFVIRGEYSNIAAYLALDIVYKDGASYVAIRDNVGKDPETETADWMLLLDGSGSSAIIDTIVAGAPNDLNNLNKIAAAIGNNPNFATAIGTALALKADTSSLAAVAFTGNYSDLLGIKEVSIRRLFMTRELI